MLYRAYLATSHWQTWWHNVVSSIPCHKWLKFVSHLWQGILDTTLCHQVCQWLVARYTRYNIMWSSLSVTCGKVYLIQHYADKLDDIMLYQVYLATSHWQTWWHNVVSSIPCHKSLTNLITYKVYLIQHYVIKFVSEVYLIQHYVIKFVSDLWQEILDTTLCHKWLTNLMT
jgi:hypothetical protein